MRTAYLDCSCGISGDMTVAALVDAGVDFESIRAGIASLGLPDVTLSVAETVRCGFRALHLQIDHPQQHAHRHLREIVQIIDRGSALTPRQKDLAKRVFLAIAEAEAKVHGTTVDRIHFHEVGAIDSIVDIVAAAIGFDLLGADEVAASAVPTGRGQVQIDHGVCTVPTPGTAELLRGIPLIDIPVDAELTTPTGAAILRTFATRFGPLPAMTVEQIGYGAGTRDFPNRANVLRLLVGTAGDTKQTDQVLMIETNLDDVPGEIVGYTKQKLLAAGALDVFSTAVQMKKDRPGVLLSVLCRLADRERLEAILFAETGTFGVRRYAVDRATRERAIVTVETPWGPVQGKTGTIEGKTLFSPEYEACARLAGQFNVALREVYCAAEAAYANASSPTGNATFAKETSGFVAGNSTGAACHRDGDSHDEHHRHEHDHDHHH